MASNDTKIESVVKEVLEMLPSGLSGVREEINNNLHAILSSAIQKMNLVSREEYEIQTQLLAKLRQRVTELEARIAEYEQNN